MKNQHCLIFIIGLWFSTFFSVAYPDDYKKNQTKIDQELDEKENVVIEGWGNLSSDVGNEIDNAVSKDALSSYLFNEFGKYRTSFNLLTKPTDGDNKDDSTSFNYGIGLSLSVNRKAIANKNVRNTYSVIDHFDLTLRPNLTLGFNPFYFKVNPDIGLTFINIRNISPSDYKGLPRLKKIIGKLTKKTYEETKYPPHDVITKSNEDNKIFIPPSDKATFGKVYLGKIFNPITQVFRLPLRVKWLEKYMAPYEIMSYSLHGGIYVGAGLGAPLPAKEAFKILTSGIGAGFFFKGSHQITVLKEPPGPGKKQYVRIRLTRLYQKGLRANIGSTATTSLKQMVKNDKLEGNFIWKTLSGVPRFRPYTYEAERSKANIYESAYRVDVSTEEGKEAYNKAARGDFRSMEHYAFKRNVFYFGKEKPVVRIYTKEEKKEIQKRTKYLELFLFSLRKTKVLTFTETHDDIEGKKGYYFDTEVLTDKKRKALFAFNNNRSHKFTIHMDPVKFTRTKDPYSLTLNIDVTRKNDNTTGKEYVQYVKEIESSLNRPGMFPLPPKGKRGYFKGYVGKTNLSYSLKINRPQLEKLFNYPVEKMWPALAKAFDAEDLGWESEIGRKKMIAKRLAVYAGTIPMSLLGYKLKEKDDILIAKMKYNRWRNLKIKSKQMLFLKDFNIYLGKFFESGDYGPEMIKLLRIILDGESIPYKGSFSSKLVNAHGTFSFGNTGRFINPSKLKIQRTFDYYKPHWRGISVTNLAATIIGKKYFTMRFDLNDVPETVFFNLRKKATLGLFNLKNPNKSLETVVIFNKDGKFKKGRNIIQLRVDDKNHPLYKIVNKLEIKRKKLFWANRYRMTVAASKNGKHYGDALWTDFRTRILSEKKAVEVFKQFAHKNYETCLGKTATELILFLGDRQFLVCPEKEPRNKDGTCKNGMNPYGHSASADMKENLEKRNDWIMKTCPKLTEDEKIKKMIKKENICLGMSGNQIIRYLGKRPFYACNPDHVDRDSKGFCKSGWKPYQDTIESEEKDPLRARNEWLMKRCALDK